MLEESDYEKYILNEKNKYITIKDIQQIFSKENFNHEPVNLANFQIAMIHKSYLKNIQLNDKIIKGLKEVEPIDNKLIKKCIPLQDKCYETLEFLGDAVIHHVFADYLFRRYEGKDQGFLTIMRIKLEKGSTLNYLARIIGLDRFLIIARNIELAGGRNNNTSILEDVFEAFIGALSLETSFENCKKFLEKLIDSHIDFANLINSDDNYKESLMQFYHDMGFKTTPTYKLIDEFDDNQKRKFKMGAYSPDGKLIGVGIGSSKSIGAKYAAKNALGKLRKTYNNLKNNLRVEEEVDDIYLVEV
jgi:dsRNA-specific ribonuclease